MPSNGHFLLWPAISTEDSGSLNSCSLKLKEKIGVLEGLVRTPSALSRPHVGVTEVRVSVLLKIQQPLTAVAYYLVR